MQRLREAERELLFQEFQQHEGDIVSGMIEQAEPGRAITMDLGRAQAILPYEEQVTNERYRKGMRSKVFVLSVRSTPKGPEILVSRSNRNMLRRLFEIEVPEVYNGVVEIKAIAREAGFRSKVAVTATQPGIDPVGSCIGIRGNRIQSIVNELQGEKIDIVSWDADPRTFISKALSPSEPVHVELLGAEQTAVVIVPDRQLSLAIGKEGQNTRLAARLTGWRLDIKGMTEWEEIREARVSAAAAEAVKAAEAALAVAAETAVAVADESTAGTAVAAELTAEPVAAAPEEAGAPAVVEPAPAQDAPVFAEPAISPVDEDSILEELMREDEAVVEAAVEAEPGLSVEDLGSFTLDDVEIGEQEAEEDLEDLFEDGIDEGPIDLGELPVLTPDAGKIRFAEDIVEEFRGGGARRGGRSRRGGGGARRGGGGR